MLNLSEIQTIGIYVLYHGGWDKMKRISVEDALFLAKLQEDPHRFVIYPETPEELERLEKLVSLELIDSYGMDNRTGYGLSNTAKTASYIPFVKPSSGSTL